MTTARAALTLAAFVSTLLLMPWTAWAYRPFISTDAAVADQRDLEIELGYFTLEQSKGENTFRIPSLVLNYGAWKNSEIVGEFRIERNPGGDIDIVDPGLFLKTVLKEGLLQEKPGVSFAMEAGPLLPSTVAGERGVGFEAIGILSGTGGAADVASERGWGHRSGGRAALRRVGSDQRAAGPVSVQDRGGSCRGERHRATPQQLGTHRLHLAAVAIERVFRCGRSSGPDARRARLALHGRRHLRLRGAVRTSRTTPMMTRPGVSRR